MRTLILLIIVTACAFAAAEEGPIEKYVAPEGRLVTSKDGTQYWSYTLDEYKVIGHIIIDYNWLYARMGLAEQKLELGSQLDKTQEARVKLCYDTGEILKADIDYWKTSAAEERKARIELQTTEKWEHFGLWALIAVESVGLGVLGIYAAAH